MLLDYYKNKTDENASLKNKYSIGNVLSWCFFSSNAGST
jgi:hypothetical protein